MKKKLPPLTFSHATTDEALQRVALAFIRGHSIGASMDMYQAERVYDGVIAIHKAREAIRRENRRKSR